MQRGKQTTLLLAVCLLLLMAITAVVSVYPVNQKVVDTEMAVKQNQQLISLQLAAKDQILKETDEDGVPMLYVWVEDGELSRLLPEDEEMDVSAGDAVPEDAEAAEPEPALAWVSLRGGEPQESYAQLTPEDVSGDVCRYALTLREINRKGRLHSNKLPLLGFEACAGWTLTGRGGAGILLPSEDGETEEKAVHLVINGEDLGRFLITPSLKETLNETD